MKKLSVGILFVVILASCKKDHECYCEYYTNGSMQTTNTFTFNETKAKAKKKCDDLNSEGSFAYGGMSVYNETKCSLK
ncbi:hypothetical protein [Fluviicola chungangensis]|uniref:Lipoprotein n=1 Tax=Fluviicola chungangensis TaxID=2597671 RepID=A0A556N2P2_9FLAO|nr:hypothetical protein [Fluviicola chungangensis]TSJ46480.1 hypothetical protein FO442_04795 [Fluviicola chungangensis]